MPHPAMSPNHVAVVTGGASGLGLAAAKKIARLGKKVCIADLGGDRLRAAETELSSAAPDGAANIMARAVDVSRLDHVTELESAVREGFGGTEAEAAGSPGIAPRPCHYAVGLVAMQTLLDGAKRH